LYSLENLNLNKYTRIHKEEDEGTTYIYDIVVVDTIMIRMMSVMVTIIMSHTNIIGIITKRIVTILHMNTNAYT